MTTPIIIFAILLLPLAAGWAIGGSKTAAFGGVLGVAAAFLFFGVGHYAQTDAMVQMLPEFVPPRRPLIFATGLLEFAIALGIVLPRTRGLAGWAAIAVLILFFPSNIYAAINQTGMGGHQWGPVYLWIRAPLQALLIGWAWCFVVRPGGPRQQSALS